MATEQIPLFEGFEPDTSEIRLTGSTPAQDESFRIGEGVYFLVRGKIVGVNHERKKVGLVRSHKVDVIGVQRIDPKEQLSEALLREAHSYLEALEDDE